MDRLDHSAIDRQARDLRREEIAKLVRDLVCTTRRAWFRLRDRTAPACDPCRGMAA